MKKLTYILIALCLACSSSDDEVNTSLEVADSTLEVVVTQNVTVAVVDQMVTLTATANETIQEISFSTDGGLTFPSSYGANFGTTASLYFAFDTLGTKTIVFRVKNNAGDIVDNTVNIRVERGNAVQFQNVQLTSFFDMGNTWDSEFPTSNPNHLADVFFAILKPSLNVFDGTRSNVASTSWLWYKSETRENENNLNWNIQNEELFINPEFVTPYIAFADDDGGGMVQDLMFGPPFERVIPLNNYTNTQPNTITVEEASIHLEYTIGVDW
ncbi:hypothetical protein [Bizionia sp.]|uniref:hypothetical protein n=1 Tax=Bizionia sp. TaxID=1954480 RepID=UPI003A95CE92